MLKKVTSTFISIAICLAATSPALAKDKSSAEKAKQKGVTEIPICTKKLGTIAVVEPDNQWWTALNLGSPEAIIKLFVMKSGCFGLVDRGKGLQSRNIERALADSGELQAGSNIGKRQVKAADYFIVPDLVTKNANSGGFGLGGALGGFIGGGAGALLGGLKVSKKEANVMLTLVNARTTEQERLVEGYARKSDVGFGGGAGGWWGGGLAAVGGSSYQNTDVGQVIVLAYLDAYTQMVTQLGGLPLDPSAAAPVAQ
ncbi:CsgG/HfaB family protein [Rhizorhapis sp. SPR117]|uniref:CsgG/HfaB family protein n=1 Tax=Rhizorhapis sp. SPR117 TaxID=2912611 RepID=UPI001F1CFC3B|nr:penicillin-binding protein activator LpoB [Rhizorhapis sp. SPR117]